MLVGILASAAAGWWIGQRNQVVINDYLAQHHSQLQNDIAARLRLYQYGLKSIASDIDNANHNEVVAAVQKLNDNHSLTTEFPGALGFGFAERSPSVGEWPVVAVAPQALNEALLDFDFARYPAIRYAADTALQQGALRLAPLDEIPNLAGGRQLLLLMPVYHGEQRPRSLSQRQQLLLGWAFVVVALDDAFSDLWLDSRFLRLRLSDVSNPDSPLLYYQSASLVDNVLAQIDNEQEFYGRLWRVELQAFPNLVQQLNLPSPTGVFLTGLVICLLLAALVEKVVESRLQRADTDAIRRRMAALIDATPDGVVTTDLQGRISDWNRGAEALFGYSAEEVLGRSLTQLIVPEGLRHEEELLFARLRQGESIANIRSRRQCKDKLTVYVSISMTPMSDHAQVNAVAMVFRYIGDEMVEQQQIEAKNRSLESLANLRSRELESSRQFMRALLDAIPPAVAYLDRNRELLLVNKAFAAMFSKSVDELVGASLPEQVHPGVLERTEQLLDKALAGASQTVENSYNLGDGQHARYLSHFIPDRRDDEILGLYLITYDVTELYESRQQLSQAVRENEALLNSINEQMAYAQATVNGELTFVNDNYCRSLGQNQSTLLGSRLKLFASDTATTPLWPEIIAAIEAGHCWQGQMCEHHSDGSWVWFQGVAAPAFDIHGKLDHLILLRLDITHSKSAERDQEQFNLLFRSILNIAAPVAIIATDPQGVITVFNRGAENLLGYRAAEVVQQTSFASLADGQDLANLNHSKTPAEPLLGQGFERFRQTLDDSGLARSHNYFRRRDQSDFVASLTLSRLTDEQGEVSGYLAVVLDISQEVNNYQALIKTRDQLAIASEVADLGVWVWDPATNLIEWNARMREIYHLSEVDHPQISYDDWRACILPDDRAELDARLQAAMANRGDFDGVFHIMLPEGGVRAVQVAAHFDRTDDGRVFSVTGINRDITEQLQVERSLREAKLGAESSSQAKSQFLANMSHEIRTPLNAVLGLLQLLRRTSLDVQQTGYAQKAETAAKSLLALLNDILDFSKIDAGKLSLDPHPFELAELLDELAIILAGNLQQDSVALVFDIAPELPARLVGDALRLQQVLINLAGNALKFTSQGYVLVRIEPVPGAQRLNSIRFEVQDTGIGIDAQQQRRLFQGFEQAEASTSRRFGGTGLGLAISKHLVDLMGGELQLQSESGVGSRFWFDLTFNDFSDQPMAERLAALVGRKVVLMVRQPQVRAALWRQLEYQGLEVWVVQELAEVLGQGARFELVITDQPLADHSRLQRVAETLSAQIILLQASGQLETASNPALIRQPFLPAQIVQSLGRVVLGDAANESLQLLPADQPLAGLTLLVVEDNAINRQIADELLTQAGARVVLAASGGEGVARVVAGDPPFDAVLMDMQMPDMDGLEATRQIRARPEYRQLPVLALTANASQADREACLAAGMNGHLAKPILLEAVIATLLEVTGKSRSERPSLAGDSHSQAEVDAIKLIEDYATVIGRFGGNEKLFAKMQPKFAPEMAKQLEQLSSAVAAGDVAASRAALHTVKGVAATVGASRLMQRAADLELIFKCEQPPAPGGCITPAVLAELATLVADSDSALAALLPAAVAPEPVASMASVMVADATLRENLAHLRKFLATDNLQALDEVESLCRNLAPEQQQKLSPVIDHVQSLAFGEALQALDTLLEEI
ncbi:PAS domain S-box protein [Halioxenophilus sp. WMMB6]|uniref:PAS domain S-box protein n=1 Tax=Halioxenophilus sp. WMMB6 TaxID=3073815 RepID=UPI00295E743E|nr:PAS domain S-box protein [Halioxenophilus sp. WMMB6]